MFIKIKMARFAWNSYKRYAWGKNELSPMNKSAAENGLFGKANDLGLTIIDSMDTLYLMDLHEEFNDGAEWIKKYFKINIVNKKFKLLRFN